MRWPCRRCRYRQCHKIVDPQFSHAMPLSSKIWIWKERGHYCTNYIYILRSHKKEILFPFLIFWALVSNCVKFAAFLTKTVIYCTITCSTGGLVLSPFIDTVFELSCWQHKTDTAVRKLFTVLYRITSILWSDHRLKFIMFRLHLRKKRLWFPYEKMF
jgi:hypothetical protein